MKRIVLIISVCGVGSLCAGVFSSGWHKVKSTASRTASKGEHAAKQGAKKGAHAAKQTAKQTGRTIASDSRTVAQDTKTFFTTSPSCNEAKALIKSGDKNNPTVGNCMVGTAESGDKEHIEHMLDKGVPVDVPNDEKQTALMGAASYGHTVLVSELVEMRGANVNKADTDGNTALMAAVKSGALRVVSYLVRRKNIKINHKNNKGETALNVAHKAAKNKKKIIAVLKKYGAKTGT